jgi:hypothetical protein
MAHAYKKTLLAQLGFADADKQNPKHDLAVEYLAQPHQARRLVSLFHKKFTWDRVTQDQGRVDTGYGEGQYRRHWRYAELRMPRSPERERPLTKGEGNYRTTVGFIDLVLQYEPVLVECMVRGGPDGEGPIETQTVHRMGADPEFEEEMRGGIIGVEVKASPLATGDLLRQVKLYREYLGGPSVRWVVAGCFKFSETQAHALRQENITPVSLGALFDEWAERRRTDRALATNIEEF